MVGRGKLLDQRFWGIGTSSVPSPFARKGLKSSVEKLSEKGYEHRSSRDLGRYKEGEMDRKAPLRPLAGLRCRRVRGFSDSFRRGILRSPHTAFLYETASINFLGSPQATFKIFEAGNVASFTLSSGRHVPAPSVKLGGGSRRKEDVRMGPGDGSHYG